MTVATRILVIGAAGSGMSTLGQALALKLEYRFFDADHYRWVLTDPPFQERVEPEVRIARLTDNLRAGAAVVSGCVVGWGTAIEDSFDLIIFRLLDTKVRLERLITREKRLYGKINPSFLERTAKYDEGDLSGQIRSRAMHEAWLAERRCRVLRIEGDINLASQIQSVLGATIDTSIGADADGTHHLGW